MTPAKSVTYKSPIKNQSHGNLPWLFFDPLSWSRSMSSSIAQKKVIVVGAGWAGLGAAYHLSKQGYAVTLLEAGGLSRRTCRRVANTQRPIGRSRHSWLLVSLSQYFRAD